MTNGKLNSSSIFKTTTIIPGKLPGESEPNGTSDLKNLKRVHKMYDGPNIIESKGIVHPETREILTVGQAISMRILDVRTGRIVTSVDKRKGISIEQAARDGLIDPKLAERLIGPCGTTEDGKEVTLLEAIQRELYDAEQGFSDPAEKRIKVISEARQIPGQGMSIAEAMNVGQVDLQKGLFRLPDGTYIAISEAYERGYLIYNEIIKIKSNAVSLSDAVAQGLVEDESGWIVDRNSGDKFQLDVAIKNKLIDPEIREIVDPYSDTKITLTRALEKGIINPKIGKYVHPLTKDKIKFSDATKKGFICKPMTLKDVVDNSLMDNNGLIASPLRKSKFNILEAIACGVLDSDNIKSITNTSTGELLTLSEALGSRIVIPETTRFRDNLTSEVCTIPEAVDRGLITSVSQKSIFDIDGFRDPVTNEFMSFNRALNNGLISSQNGGSIVINAKPTQVINMNEGVELGAIRTEVYEMLNRKIGIFERDNELTVLQAVFKGILNPNTGYLLNPENQQPLPLDKAVEVNLITPEGAVLLNSLLNITLTTQTVTKTVKRYVTYTDTGMSPKSEITITFSEAIRRGLIDETSQTFTDPTSGTIIPIEQALHEGLVCFDTPAEKHTMSPIRVIKKESSGPGQYVELKITKKSFIKDPPVVSMATVDSSPIQKVSITTPKTPISHSQMTKEFVTSEKIDPNILVSTQDQNVDTLYSTTHTKTVTDRVVTTDFISSERRSMEKQIFSLPPDGWYLGEAIDQQLFDPIVGVFVIPNTDRIVSFKECVEIQIINPKSASVIDPKSNRKITLIRSLEKGILDSSGQYKLGKSYIPMKQAIERQLVILENRPVETSPTRRLLQITKQEGKPDVVEVSNVLDDNPPKFTEIKSTDSVWSPEPIQMSSNLVYDPTTATIIDTDSGKSENVIIAIKKGLVDPCLIKVKDPSTGDDVTAKEAIKRGILDENTGNYVDKKGRRMTLLEAAKLGALTVVAAPIIAGTKTIQIVKRTFETVPKTVTQTPMEVDENVASVIISHVPIKEASTTSKIIITDPRTGRRLSGEQAVKEGLISSDQLQTFVTSETTNTTHTITRSQKIISNVIITDPITGQELTIEEAVQKGIVPPEKLKEILSEMPESENKQQLIIEQMPEDSNKTQVIISKKSIPITNIYITDPNTGKKLTPEEALKAGLITKNQYDDILRDPSKVQFNIVEKTSSILITEPETGKQISPEEALKKGLISPEQLEEFLSNEVSKTSQITVIKKSHVLITHPRTGKQLTPEEALKEGLITLDEFNNIVSAENVDPTTVLTDKVTKTQKTLSPTLISSQEFIKNETFTSVPHKLIITEKISPENISHTVTENTVHTVVVKDPKTGNEITINEAIEKGLITPEYAEQITKTIDNKRATSPEKTKILTEAELTRSRVTVDPKFRVTIGNARSYDSAKPVTLQKMRKKVVSPKDAIEKGMIDDETAEILNKKENFISPTGEQLTISEAVANQIVDGERGRIIDPQRGDVLNINEAIERGILDPDGSNQLLIPLAQSLSVPKLAEQGLIEPETSKIIHPETGDHLSLGEAIICDIVDPLSKLTGPNGKKTTLKQAIADGNVDDEKSVVKAKGRNVDLISAVDMNVFDKEPLKISPVENIPPAGMTLPVAIQRGLVDSEGKHIVHPITGLKTPIEKAIDDDFIMAVPFPIKPNAIEIKEALEKNLIDSKKGTFVHPDTNQEMPVSEAIENGLLIVKALPEYVTCEAIGATTSVTETITSHHTITTRMVEILSGYILLNANEVQNTTTGEIMPIEEARERGIIQDEQTNKEHFTTTDVKVSFDDAVEQGLVDMESGTYKDPNTGSVMTISDAINVGKLDTSMQSPSKSIVVEEKEIVTIKTELMTLIEAYELIYDEKTGKFRDPKNPKKFYTFKEALEKKIIDPNSIIFDVQSGKQITLKEAMKKGLIDPKTGKVKDKSSGKSIDIKNAAKMGLLAVVASPVLAGMAIVKGVKSLTTKSEKEKSPDKPVSAKILSPDSTKVAPEIPLRSKKDLKKIETEIIPDKEKIKSERPVSEAINIQEEIEVTTSMKSVDIIEKVPEQISTKEIMTTQKTSPSEESDVVFMRLPLGDAIAQRKIEPKVCRILINGQESPLTVQDALDQRELSPLNLVDIVSKNCVSVVSEKPKSPESSLDQLLDVSKLVEFGIYDPEKQVFFDRETGLKITFFEGISMIIDPRKIYVKDLNSKVDKYIPLEEAFFVPLLDKYTGHMVDPKSGKRVSFFECIKRGWIVENQPPSEVYEPLTFENALHSGLFNMNTGEFTDPNTGDVYTLAEAIQLNMIDPSSISMRDPINNEIISLSDAIELGYVDIQRGIIIDFETRQEIEFKIAFLRGILIVSSRRPVSIESVIRMDLYDPATGKVKDLSTCQKVTISEAIERGIVHATISEVKDTRANSFVSLDDALNTKLVNSDTGKLRDTKEGSLITLDIALQKGFVTTKSLTWSLVDIIDKGYYSPKTGRILDPVSGKELSVADCIEQQVFEIEPVKIKDDDRDKLLTVNEALRSGLLDGTNGVITNPCMTLDVANEKGYLLSDKKPWSLQEGLVQGCYDPDSGLLTIDTKTKTLDEAIKKGEIDPDVMTVKNSKSGEIITLTDAIKAGIIDSKLGKAKDPLKGDEITFVDASERGLIIPAKRKFSLPEAVFKGFYDPKTGKFIHPDSKEKIATDRALRKGMLDPQSTIVNIDGRVMPFEFAVDRGLVDSRTGTIIIGDREKIDFQEAFERGVLIEVRKPMSLSEAVSKGIYDENTGLFMDPKSGKKYSLSEAIKLHLIDPDSVHVKDIRSGSWKKISLPESLETGVVDSKTGKVKDINKDNSELTIKEAFQIGLLVDNKAPISLQRAIHQGLYDEKTGKFSDPVSGRKITLHESIRRFIIDPKYLCYFDKKSEKPLTLSETCRSGVIDRRSGEFIEPNSDVPIPLSKAMELGLIVDIEGANFSLYDSLAMGLYDVEQSKFRHPVSEKLLTLNEAIVEELISPETSLVKSIKQSKYIKLPEAIKMKLIDDNLCYYNLPNGNSINLIEARLRGLIVTNHKGLSIEEAVRNGLFRPDTGKFVDPTSGDFLDLNAAIASNFIDPDTTALKDPNTNKLKSLTSAIESGDIDVNKGRILDSKLKRAYNIEVALEKGYLVTIIRPLTSSRHRRLSIDYTKDKEPLMREFTLDEAIRFEYIDPETAVVKDPNTGKFRPLKLAITEGVIDINIKTAFDPQSGRSKSVCFVFENGLIIYLNEPLTFEQAIEMKLLDIQTARFTDPQSNDVLTVKDAAVLGHIDSDTALVKDNLKKKLIKLPEAFRKGLMDAEKGNILDTETSKLNPLPVALDTGLLMTPKRAFTLQECLEFGIYNPTTGGFSDPFITTSVIDRKRLTLTDSIDQGIIDPSSTVIKDPTSGQIVPLHQAISTNLIDPVGGRLILDPAKDVSLDLVKAQAKGYILAAETWVSSLFDILNVFNIIPCIFFANVFSLSLSFVLFGFNFSDFVHMSFGMSLKLNQNETQNIFYSGLWMIMVNYCFDCFFFIKFKTK